MIKTTRHNDLHIHFAPHSNLTPGGYIELHDPTTGVKADDGTLPDDSALLKWDQTFLEATTKAGSPMSLVSSYKKMLVDAGFVDVVEVKSMWPSNTWPKDEKWKAIGKFEPYISCPLANIQSTRFALQDIKQHIC